MKRIRKVTILLTLWVILAFSFLSCTSGATDTGHDILKRELGTVQDELSECRSELREAEEELNTTRYELDKSKSKIGTTEGTLNDTLIEMQELKRKLAETEVKREQYQAKYEELSIKYEELRKQYDMITEETTAIINEGEVEQAIFELINQERTDNEFDALIWNDGLYSCARGNNYNMAKTNAIQHPDCASFQQVFWFLGYGTADRIANTALIVWKSNPYSYKQNVLNNAVFGAVAVYKSEEILYITFLSDTDVHIR